MANSTVCQSKRKPITMILLAGGEDPQQTACPNKPEDTFSRGAVQIRSVILES